MGHAYILPVQGGGSETARGVRSKEAPKPTWCPSNQSAKACELVNPLGLPPKAYEKGFAGSLGTVCTAGTLSPWGTLDQGGNAVEWTDTITPPPFGLQPQDNAFFAKTYPWLGLRIGVVGALKPAKG